MMFMPMPFPPALFPQNGNNMEHDKSINCNNSSGNQDTENDVILPDTVHDSVEYSLTSDPSQQQLATENNEQFNRSQSDLQNHHMNTWFPSKGLHITHLNIHYLFPKLDEIKILLNDQSNIDILCLCETFLNGEFSDDELQIESYEMTRKDRQSHGGGLIVYTKANLSCIHRDDLEIPGAEILWIEVKNNKQKPFLLCYCYKPPSAAYIDWITELDSAIEKANTEQKEIILLGDFNFNLLSITNVTKHWLDTTNSLNLKQLVQTPTRVTNSTRTLIDHAFTNVQENITQVSVPVYALSDHYPVCLTRKISNDFESGPIHKLILYRDTKSFNEATFISELENQPWTVIDIHCNAVITRLTGAIKSNRVISDTAL